MHSEVLDKEETLTRLFNEAKALQQLKDLDVDVKAQFVWYLCVRTAGFVEYSVQTILSEYFESGLVHPPLGYFVSKNLLAPHRFSLLRVRELIDSFETRQSQIGGEYDLTKLDASIESIRTNRNSIAHGRDANHLTIMALDAYFEDAKKLIRMVYKECNPPHPEDNN